MLKRKIALSLNISKTAQTFFCKIVVSQIYWDNWVSMQNHNKAQEIKVFKARRSREGSNIGFQKSQLVHCEEKWTW